MTDNTQFLLGYPLIPVVEGWEGKLQDLFKRITATHMGYKYGGKDPTPWDEKTIDFNGIDCSGLVRIMLGYITDERLRLPDGSQAQGDFFRTNKFKESSRGALAEQDGILRVGIYRVKPGVPVGHIFLCLNGMTYESHGGVGPSQRVWNNRTIQAISDEVYAIAAPTPSRHLEAA